MSGVVSNSAMMESMSDWYAELLQKIDSWHDDDEHEQIIDEIERLSPDLRDYRLIGLLARAYNNYAQPEKPDYQELLERARDLLLSVETDGIGDAVWHYRIGYSLFWLNREPEAIIHFEQAVALNPDDEDSKAFVEWCKRIIENRTVVKPFSLERLAAYFEEQEWVYEHAPDGSMRSGWGDFLVSFVVSDDWHCLSIWRPDVPLERRSELLEACNEWNRNTRRPKVYARTQDDGAVWACGEHYVFCAGGLTEEAMEANLKLFLRGSAEFFEFLGERFPDLVPPAEDSE